MPISIKREKSFAYERLNKEIEGVKNQKKPENIQGIEIADETIDVGVHIIEEIFDNYVDAQYVPSRDTVDRYASHLYLEMKELAPTAHENS